MSASANDRRRRAGHATRRRRLPAPSASGRRAEEAPLQSSPSAPEWRAATVLIGLAFVLRLAVVLQLGSHSLLQPRGVLDDAVYVELAGRVASGDLALRPDVYFVSPLYTYFLGAIFRTTGGSVLAARVVQAALGASCVGLIYLTAAAWFGRRAAWVAGLLAALSGVVVFNEMLILQAALDPFLTAFALFALTRAVRGGATGWFAWTGVAFGLLAANRPNALPVVFAVALAWLAFERSRAAAFRAAACVLGAVLVLTPFAVRNRVVAGEWVFIASHGGLNFYIGNNETADGTWQSVPGIRRSIAGQREDVQRVAAASLGRPVTSSEASDYFYERAWSWIRSHPGRWLALLGRKLALTFNAADIALNYSYDYFARDERSLLAFLVAGPWLVFPLGLFGLWAGWKRGTPAAFATWILFVPVYAATLILFFVSTRYRLPLVVPLTTASGAGIVWLWERAASRQTRHLAAGLAALVALFAAVNWPLDVPDGRMFQREEQVVRLLDENRVDEALALYERTEPDHPNRPALQHRIGVLLLDRDRPHYAVQLLERALQAKPAEAWIRFDLGQALIHAGRPADAVPHLAAAREAGIEPASSFALAQAHAALGNLERARHEMRSIPLVPDAAASDLLRYGAVSLKLQDLQTAERFLSEATSRDPGLAAAYEHLGVVFGLQGRPAEAVGAFRKALELEPGKAAAHFHLAVAHAQLGEFADARTHALQALSLEPGYREARMLLDQLPR